MSRSLTALPSALALSALLSLSSAACLGAADSAGPLPQAGQNCDEVRDLIAQECVVNGSLIATEDCEQGLLYEALKEACPERSVGERDLELCFLGVDEKCGSSSEPDPESNGEDLEAQQCSEYIGVQGADACDFYLCRDGNMNQDERCGDEGYYLGYGYKYCNRFQNTADSLLSAEGAAWVDRVMPCLMEAIEEEVDSLESCEGILEISLNSHPQCYVDSGFCDLSLDDMGLVFLTIDFSDFDMRQVLTTGVSCLSQWAE